MIRVLSHLSGQVVRTTATVVASSAVAAVAKEVGDKTLQTASMVYTQIFKPIPGDNSTTKDNSEKFIPPPSW